MSKEKVKLYLMKENRCLTLIFLVILSKILSIKTLIEGMIIIWKFKYLNIFNNSNNNENLNANFYVK